MNSNEIKLNSTSKLEVDFKSLRTSKRLWLEILQFMWIWLKPRNLPEIFWAFPPHRPLFAYSRLEQIIRISQQACDASINRHLSSLCDNQRCINNLRDSEYAHFILRDFIDPDDYVTTYTNIVQQIFMHQEIIDEDSRMIKVSTTESRLCWQDLSIIKQVKTLYACCYGIPSTMECKTSTKATNPSGRKYY